MSLRITRKAVCRDGYSLAELVLVLACIAILISAAVPNITRLQDEWALLGGARILEASLQWGRMHAIAANTSLLFEVDSVRQEFCWADPVSGDHYENSVRLLPRGVRILSAPKRPLRFFPHGNAAPAGTFDLAGDAGSYSVIVTPGGRIRIQRN
jgi:type II secretory pathway pseudopilin PulG